jgi:hypothetical protein
MFFDLACTWFIPHVYQFIASHPKVDREQRPDRGGTIVPMWIRTIPNIKRVQHYRSTLDDETFTPAIFALASVGIFGMDTIRNCRDRTNLDRGI